MKKRLEEKLDKPEIDRSKSWFWKNHLYPKIPITYAYFMIMLNEPDRMRDDVKAAINEFLDQE